MVDPAPILRRPVPADAHEALDAHAELAAEGFDFLLGLDPARPWVEYVERCVRAERGEGLSSGWTASTFLLGVLPGGDLAGRVSLRHRLVPFIAEAGGHIGYAVRPAYRRRGVATAMLRGALDVARSLGLDQVLLTCDDDNAASAAVIERCGGVFERLVDPSRIPPEAPLAQELTGAMRRYWIRIA